MNKVDKAEQRAFDAYPIVMSQYSDNCKEYDSNESDRLTFIEGYHQAEKDLELTWEDMKHIYLLTLSVSDKQGWKGTDKSIYQEVLKQFKRRK